MSETTQVCVLCGVPVVLIDDRYVHAGGLHSDHAVMSSLPSDPVASGSVREHLAALIPPAQSALQSNDPDAIRNALENAVEHATLALSVWARVIPMLGQLAVYNPPSGRGTIGVHERLQAIVQLGKSALRWDRPDVLCEALTQAVAHGEGALILLKGGLELLDRVPDSGLPVPNWSDVEPWASGER